MKRFILISLLSCMVVGQVFGADPAPQNQVPARAGMITAVSLGITGFTAGIFGLVGKIVGYSKAAAAIGVLAANASQLVLLPQIRDLGVTAYQDAFPHLAPAAVEQRIDGELALMKKTLYVTGALAGLYLML